MTTTTTTTATTAANRAACGHPASFVWLAMHNRQLCAYCAMVAKAK